MTAPTDERDARIDRLEQLVLELQRAVLIHNAAQVVMLKAQYQAVRWPGATAERVMKKLDEVAAMFKT